VQARRAGSQARARPGQRAPASSRADPLGWPLPAPQVEALIERRLNRFAVRVRLVGGPEVPVHLPNSGRLMELLRRGRRARVHLWERPRGATVGTLLLVRHRGRWVGVDAHVPNRILEAAFARGALGPLRGVRRWWREVRVGRERLDFLVETVRGTWLVEAKSCNRVVGHVALFPDAPTARGARHLRLLARWAARGRPAAVVWIVQRSDARELQIDASVDPALARAAERARQAGVRFLAWRCRMSPRAVVLTRPIPVGVASRGRRILGPR
jgi:sugar fermentation stimulation protein A